MFSGCEQNGIHLQFREQLELDHSNFPLPQFKQSTILRIEPPCPRRSEIRYCSSASPQDDGNACGQPDAVPCQRRVTLHPATVCVDSSLSFDLSTAVW